MAEGGDSEEYRRFLNVFIFYIRYIKDFKEK